MNLFMKTGRKITHGYARRGVKRPHEYNCWMHMVGRCTNKNHCRYGVYGKVGIVVCHRWRKFGNFIQDMGLAPTPKHSIDRYPNKKGNYKPGTVRWATQQARNTTRNRMIAFKGETLCVSEWAERLSVDRGLITCRLNRGWSIRKTLTTPVITTFKKKIDAMKNRTLAKKSSGNKSIKG